MRGHKIPGLPTLFVCLFLTASALGDDAKYQLKVATDRPDAIYETGERARFIVTLTKDDQPVTDGTVSYIVDDFITDHPENSDQPRGELQIGEQAEIEVHLLHPGFLRCQVSYRSPEKKTFKAIAGAGFSPAKIGLSLPVPDDFDEFWDAQKAELVGLPAAANLTPLEYKDQDVDCFDVQVPCIGAPLAHHKLWRA
jgi:cephalosporin-C deacetylase